MSSSYYISFPNPRHSWKRKTLGLATYILKSILMQKKKKNYGNSNISPCQNIIFPKKKSSKRNKNLSRYYYNNSIITNLKFQHKKPKYNYQLSKVLV
jgi:hypothetical protein